MKDSNKGFNEISDLDQFLIKDPVETTDLCSENSECAVPGYIVALSSSVNGKD